MTELLGTVILSVEVLRFRVVVEVVAIAALAITLPYWISFEDDTVATACAISPYLEELACVPKLSAEFVVLSLIE